MAENTRSHDLRRMEESIKEILNKLNVHETNITAIGLQQGQIMAQLHPGEPNGGSSNNGLQESQDINGGAPNRSYFATRKTKVDFPRFGGEDLKGWLF